jgi:oligopeptide/dipeptide ABC transporter ATP-binding protein
VTKPVPAPSPLLSIQDLSIDLDVFRGRARVVDRVSLTVAAGEVLGLVGESGSGKSMTAMAVLRLLPSAASVAGGRILLDGQDLLTLTEAQMRRVRGHQAAMIFQTSVLVLNPLLRVGDQIARVFEVHLGTTKAVAHAKAVAMLDKVGIRNPERVSRGYPHELSGGMVQRALIALMMAAQPRLLIADEPTTGLDVTTEVQIFDLLKEIRRETKVAILLITHDLGTVAENADRVAIMHAGHIVETGPTHSIFKQPKHPYTRALLASIPRLDTKRAVDDELRGQAPDIFTLRPDRCRFVDRCPAAMEICLHQRPPLVEVSEDHAVFCHLYGGAVAATIGEQAVG